MTDTTPATDATTLAAATAAYQAVADAVTAAHAAKLAADAAYELRHSLWMAASREYAATVFGLTTGPAGERIVVTDRGAIICRIKGTPSGTGTMYAVDHAPIAATVLPRA